MSRLCSSRIARGQTLSRPSCMNSGQVCSPFPIPLPWRCRRRKIHISVRRVKVPGSCPTPTLNSARGGGAFPGYWRGEGAERVACDVARLHDCEPVVFQSDDSFQGPHHIRACSRRGGDPGSGGGGVEGLDLHIGVAVHRLTRKPPSRPLIVFVFVPITPRHSPSVARSTKSSGL